MFCGANCPHIVCARVEKSNQVLHYVHLPEIQKCNQGQVVTCIRALLNNLRVTKERVALSAKVHTHKYSQTAARPSEGLNLHTPRALAEYEGINHPIF